MKIRLTLAGLGAGVALVLGAASIAESAPINGGVTEGTRKAVTVDTTTLPTTNLGDTTSGPTGYDVGTIGAGAIFGIYGRIVGAQDTFSAVFEVNSVFNIAFDFDGWTASGSGTGATSAASGQSGLVSVDSSNNDAFLTTGGKSVTFSLFSGGTTGGTLVGSLTKTTNYVSGDAVLFSGLAAGSYTLQIDGSVSQPNQAAFYDLNIIASPAPGADVPLPAALPLFVSGLAGLAFVGRRRKRKA
ncbi:MAG: VPLPA-CTERM sorting domain-containing protein [Salaquimonas sp.]|nr:VPLPA-CTERM sorting domain-containing protein [Salaquimonas sp.]